VIFANGQLNGLARLQPDDLIIAADGGAQHCLKLGIRPQVVIGDFDSVSVDELETLRSQGAEIIA
jgi:thiamine pyrophosphokinase